MKFTSLFSIICLLILASCAENVRMDEDSEIIDKEDTTNVVQEEVDVEKEGTPDDYLAIEKYRNKIENALQRLRRDSIVLNEARAQHTQTWYKLHYYSDGDQIVRIKTYPFEDKSLKSEEFYFKDGGLVFAFVEDEGASVRGKSENAHGYGYYFHNGKVIKEMSVPEGKQADPEVNPDKLVTEAEEYLEMIRTIKK